MEIEHEHRDEAEDEHGDRVLGPAHLVGFVDAGQAVDQALDGARNWIEECGFALEERAP